MFERVTAALSRAAAIKDDREGAIVLEIAHLAAMVLILLPHFAAIP